MTVTIAFCTMLMLLDPWPNLNPRPWDPREQGPQYRKNKNSYHLINICDDYYYNYYDNNNNYYYYYYYYYYYCIQCTSIHNVSSL